MRHRHFLRNLGFSFLTVFVFHGCSGLCKAQSPNYEAANWNTWFLDNPKQITFAAPPNAAQTKAELVIVK